MKPDFRDHKTPSNVVTRLMTSYYNWKDLTGVLPLPEFQEYTSTIHSDISFVGTLGHKCYKRWVDVVHEWSLACTGTPVPREKLSQQHLKGKSNVVGALKC